MDDMVFGEKMKVDIDTAFQTQLLSGIHFKEHQDWIQYIAQIEMMWVYFTSIIATVTASCFNILVNSPTLDLTQN